MTPLDAALAYAVRGLPVFPCRWCGPCRKHPLTPNGFFNASTNPTVITAWWRRWPQALIGVPTGCGSGLIVLDVDVKRVDRNGFDTLAELGRSIFDPAQHAAGAHSEHRTARLF
jgi:hypothetical protein